MEKSIETQELDTQSLMLNIIAELTEAVPGLDHIIEDECREIPKRARTKYGVDKAEAITVYRSDDDYIAPRFKGKTEKLINDIHHLLANL